MKKLFTILLVLCFGAISVSSQTVHIVEASNFVYTPADITVSPGDIIRFVWIEGNHPTSSLSSPSAFPPFPLNSGATTQDVVLNDPGFYPYQCDLHFALGMVGTVTVEESCDSSNPPDGLMSTVSPAGVALSWNPVPQSVGCQVKVTTPTGAMVLRNKLGFEANNFNIPIGPLSPGTYNYQIRCACSISPLDVTAFSAPASFTIPVLRNSAINNSVSIYPNPASDILYINLSSEVNESAVINIYDHLGRMVYSENKSLQSGINRILIDLNDMTAGLYFVEVVQNNYVEAVKITIN